MPNAYQYKTAGTANWSDIPDAAKTGTWQGGGPLVMWPAPTALAADGRPCAAIGNPQIIMRSKIMSGAGLAWWDAFVPSGAESGTFYISAYNPRSGGWSGYKGHLHHVSFTGEPYMMAAATYFTDVMIVLTECEAAT